MPKRGLGKLVEEKEDYDLESRAIIDGLVFAEKEIGQLNEMRRTVGWKIMEKKVREELQARIYELVKDDQKIQVLLSLLGVADTKTHAKALDEEIKRLLPEE